MLILVEVPGPPPEPVIVTPGILPATALSGSASDLWRTSLELKLVTA